MNPFTWFKRTPSYTLVIYMKSGNRIVLNNLIKYKIKNEGNSIVSIELEQNIKRGNTCLLASTVDLTQIEAVTARHE